MQTFAKFRLQLYLLTTTCLVAWHCSRTLLTLTSLAHEPVTASINTSTVLIPLYHHPPALSSAFYALLGTALTTTDHGIVSNFI